MGRSRSNSPALQGSSHMANRRDQLHQSRRRSRSPDANRRRRHFSDEKSKTFRNTSRDRATSRNTFTSRSPLKRRRSPYSPLTRRIKEQPSSFNSRKRRSSASPSPPNDNRDNGGFDKKTLTKIKIMVPNVEHTKDDVDVKRRRRIEKGITTLEQLLRLTEDSGVSGYHSQEFETPANKELRKIQIEIRRTIPRERISTSPVRRSLRDPSTVVFTRRPDEGIQPIFDRDEIKHWIPDVPEKRVIALISDRSPNRMRKRSLSPVGKRLKRSLSSERQDTYFRSRLGAFPKDSSNSSSRRNRDKSEENLNAVKSNIRSRLGSKTSARNSENVEAMDSAIYDEDKVLDRNELERLRFANAFSSGSWDSNPENVPRGNYFEHDNRDNDSSGGPVRSRGRGQRGFSRRGGSNRWIHQRNQRNGASWHSNNERNDTTFANRGNYRREERSRDQEQNRSESGVNNGYYRPNGKNDDEAPILWLPAEMMAKIFSHVPYYHLVTQVSLVCKKFHQIISEDNLLVTDLDVNLSSYSSNFEEKSRKTIDLLSSAISLKYLTVHVNDRLCGMLKAVGENCKRLRGLKILYSTGTFISLAEKTESSSHLISIAENCIHLKELRLLINCSFYPMGLIKQMLLARRDTLKILEIDSFELNRDVFHHIANCEKLEELRLPKFTRLSRLHFNILTKKMSNIKVLELCVRRVSDEHLAKGLSKCSSLEELILHQADRMSSGGLKSISALTKLKKLHLSILSRGLIKPDDLLNPFVYTDGNLKSLEYLELIGNLDISDMTLIRIVQKHESLTGIVLDGCNNVTAECFRYLYKNYPNLNPLKINNHSFPSEGEGIMENLKSYGQNNKYAKPYVPYVFDYII